jgi:magnesium-transporting ATPase (P-type)
MVTGDHIETAKAVAVKVGIVRPEELQLNGIAMTGDQFRDSIGQYSKIWDPTHQEFRIEFIEQKKFDEVKKKLKIIARCTAEDKFVLVAGIKQKGGLVGMTGDSIADADALKKADVGLCMGSGCDVAKDNSDLVILDNDFVSIHKSVKWGRAIFDNVRKFIQFQLTINIVICFITILGGATLGHAPLNVVQMLWTNLIMDILGAIAIGTEPYKKSQEKSNRISRRDKIILAEVWRQVLVQALYQIIVMMFLMYFGQFIFFEKSFNLITTKIRDSNDMPTDRLVLDTICFHTFILMNLFNQINCRVVDPNELNVFLTLFNNLTFWVIMAIELGIQHLMIGAASSKLGSALLGTAVMTEG